MNHFFINPAHIHAPVAARRASVRPAALEKPEAGAWDDYYYAVPDGHEPLSYEIKNGIAVISVNGALASADIPGWHWMADLTYESLTGAIQAAVEDGDVKGVLLSMNSPGGTVTGCAAAAAIIDRLSEAKPIWAHAQMADSAAYWLASATNHIVVDPTGEVGSIGVICTHMDFSKHMEEWGIKATHIFSGKVKADGSPYEPLSDDAKKRFQADMDFLRGQFVGAVSKFRGADASDIKSTEAMTYIGELGVQAGLADEVMFLHDLLQDFSGFAETQNATPKQESNTMAKRNVTGARAPKASEQKPDDDKEKKGKTAEGDEDDGDESEKKDEAKGSETDKDEKAEDEDGTEEGDEDDEEEEKASTSAERSRVAKILRCKEAKGRRKLAENLAFDTDMTPEQAAKTLAAAAQEQEEGGLAAGMRTLGNPKVGASGDGGDGGGGAAENPLIRAVGKYNPGRIVKKIS